MTTKRITIVDLDDCLANVALSYRHYRLQMVWHQLNRCWKLTVCIEEKSNEDVFQLSICRGFLAFRGPYL